eukprot:gnl/TRDRNA2_/TRDRNA2_47466_c0_seq1.p1 gnl/TRDRNA2_/TRDRNA2_47466_c0~~gnl/TRDRNA2_/TRDRNA2_47466_c0_seq1.p1  ORF type:complete len:323 (-),score=17.71 gnl/TRDRNA2_/TRDRNA2_47466_c0_seq1:96-1037(-)
MASLDAAEKGEQNLIQVNRLMKMTKSTTAHWDMPKRKYAGRAYIDMLKCWTAFAEKHKFPWVLLGGSVLHAAIHNEHAPWDTDMDIITTKRAQEAIRLEFRGLHEKHNRTELPAFSTPSVLGPDVANCRQMNKQYGVEEINNGPTFGKWGAPSGWIEFWSDMKGIREFYPHYLYYSHDKAEWVYNLTEVNKRLVSYNFRQTDGSLESIPVYVPDESFSAFMVKKWNYSFNVSADYFQHDHNYTEEFKHISELKPLYNKWNGHSWIFDETVYKRGKGLDYGENLVDMGTCNACLNTCLGCGTPAKDHPCRKACA